MIGPVAIAVVLAFSLGPQKRALPKKAPAQICDELMALNIAKLTSAENLELRFVRKDGDWKELQKRLVEIHADKLKFWALQIQKYNSDAPEQCSSYAIAFYKINAYSPLKTPSENEQLDKDAREFAADFVKKAAGF